MLFKALLRRLNGGTDTASTKVSSSHRHSSQLVFRMYPNLQALILRLLINDNQSTQSNSSESDTNGNSSFTATRAQSVFAALEVVERSGMPPSYESNVRKLLWRYAGSPDWSLREKAAKALSLVVDGRDVETEITTLLPPQGTSQNVLHGRLLYLRFLLGRAETPLVGEALRK